MKNKSKFFPLLKRDIKLSFFYSKYKYLVFFTFLSILTVSKSLSVKNLGGGNVDVFFLLLKDEGYFLNLSDISIPVNWIFIQYATLFLISDYYVNDFKNNSIYILVRTQNKSAFFLSKVVWLIWQILIVFISISLIVYLVSSAILGSFSIKFTPLYKVMITTQLDIKVTPLILVLHILIGFILTTLILSIFQLLCMQFLTPIISYFCVISISSISIIADSKWLPAIHSMILKQEIFDVDHALSFQFSITYCVIIFILLAFISTYIYQRKDIL
jgi:hypothetical protein